MGGAIVGSELVGTAGAPERQGPPERSGGVLAPAPAAAEGGSPPETNRGVKTGLEVTAGVHWLSLTVFRDWRELVGVVASLMGVKTGAAFEGLGHGGPGYARALVGPLGVRVYGDPVSGPVQSHVVVPGGAIEVLGDGWLYGLQAECDRRRWRTRATRVDLALDGGRFGPMDCLREWEAGNVRTYTRRDTYGVEHNREGVTFKMGSRTSERYGRVYDKRGFTRVEVEAKGARAEGVWLHLCLTDPVGRPDVVKGHVLDFVEFSAPWWSELLGGAARAMLKVGSVVQATADHFRGWVLKQVAPTLAALVELDGGDLQFVSELLREGRRRYGPRQKLLLAMVAV